jgi:hypothetical protein
MSSEGIISRFEMGRLMNTYMNLSHELEQIIENVRALHIAGRGPADDVICIHCYADEYHYYEYPCPTIKTLDGENPYEKED